MEIYLDSNATTAVLPQARSAALHAMAEGFGNPSSVHCAGLKARVGMDETRARARRLLGAQDGRLLFVSGATEGIQTAVLSALAAIRAARDAGRPAGEWLLYGATEHKAVPEALRHWNRLLGLDLPVLQIPVGRDGRHDLAWLREHAPRAGLVCTMAANNETGVISDLDGIESALAGSPALWLVDCVQALGKMAMRLDRRRIDYAPFSGHKLYAPKGIGLLYVREGAPFTPLMAGGGQEHGQRSGTENMPGIAALGAVLAALEDGTTFAAPDRLAAYRDRLADALQKAFPGLVFNAPPDICLPTTLNFSVPGLASGLLLDLFDAAGVRVSGGSACGASQALPSYVLGAMAVPAWQAASAVRLSFGPAVDEAFVDAACRRIQSCGDALRASCLNGSGQPSGAPPADGLTRWVVDGACCYLLADAGSRRCVVIDPVPALASRIAQWLDCQNYEMAAVLHTRPSGFVPPPHPGASAAGPVDGFGWPADARCIDLGARRLTRLAPELDHPTPVYRLQHGAGPERAFVGDLSGTVLDGLLPADALLLPGHDRHQRFASTLALALAEEAAAPAELPGVSCPGPELTAADLERLRAGHPDLLMVDVRERYEHGLGALPSLAGPVRIEAVALSGLLDALPGWLALPARTPLLFFCRSGGRSAQAAHALRRLGRAQSFSLSGGIAAWS